MAEIELRAEIKKVIDDYMQKSFEAYTGLITEELTRLRAENAALTTENQAAAAELERLRGELAQAQKLLRRIDHWVRLENTAIELPYSPAWYRDLLPWVESEERPKNCKKCGAPVVWCTCNK